MQILRSSAAMLLAAALIGCAAQSAAPPPGGPAGAARGPVARSTEQDGRFIALVGPKVQHADPFLGVPGTNVYALRSWIDTRSGDTVHQLYVAESYAGAARDWNAAHDAQGRPLRFIAIGKNEITCERGCSYAEEFAAALPDATLRAGLGGLSVTFGAKSGQTKTIAVPGELVRMQLAAVDQARATQSQASAAPPAPPR